MTSSALNLGVLSAKISNIQNAADSSTVYSAGVWSFKNASAVASVTIDNSGNMGVGTASPFTFGTYKSLDIRGAGGGWLNMGTTGTSSFYIFTDGTNSGVVTQTNGYLGFSTNNTERARIDSSGVLWTGGISSVPTGATGFSTGVFVSGSSSNSSLFYTTGGLNAGVPIQSARQTDGAGIYFFRNGSAAGYIQVTTGAISNQNSSDYRLKDNVQTLTGSLNKILKVRPVTFTWKENGEPAKSVIAHELQEVFPDAVIGEKDAVNEDGSIKTQTVGLDKLLPDLIVAIQELSAKVDAQAAEIEALKAK